MSNPLRELAKYGQSVWYDYICRALIESGDLKKLIDEDGLSSVTSNPSIFEKAIAGSTDYDRELEQLAKARDLNAKAVFERLAIHDIQVAADLFRPTYEATRRGDGYVSMEVAPTLAGDTAATIEEARRLWKEIARENAMIKVPATPEGIPAIQALIAEGININVTLLFARDVYEQVADAYIRGRHRRTDLAPPIGKPSPRMRARRRLASPIPKRFSLFATSAKSQSAARRSVHRPNGSRATAGCSPSAPNPASGSSNKIRHATQAICRLWTGSWPGHIQPPNIPGTLAYMGLSTGEQGTDAMNYDLRSDLGRPPGRRDD